MSETSQGRSTGPPHHREGYGRNPRYLARIEEQERQSAGAENGLTALGEAPRENA